MEDDLKVYTPQVVPDSPLPGQDTGAVYSSSQATPAGVYQPTQSPATKFPEKRVAVELIGNALNTKSKKIMSEFQFTPTGALQIGKYDNGNSGDIRISPIGFLARNKDGTITVAIDGDTGDAIFAGRIQTGTLISGVVAVGDSDIVIDGEAKRMIFYDDAGIPAIVIGNV